MKEEVPFHRVHRLLTSGPICLLTTRYKGEVHAAMVPWCCPISLEPPRIALAIHPSRYIHDMLPRSEECVLNIPGRPYAEQMLKCAEPEGADEEALRNMGLTLESGQRVEVPRIDEFLAHIECQLIDVLTPGDHSLFIVEVVGAWAETEAFQEHWLYQDVEELLPLHYLGGRQFCLMGPIIDLSKPPE
ncbi:MAG: flavin reductase [Chloroflexi bacterium]|nr:flavin reductase [Chloroflexota bacterium]